MSHHFEMQHFTKKMGNKAGFIYTTLVQVGRVGMPLPDKCFESILGHTRQSPPATLEMAAVVMIALGGKYVTADPHAKTAIEGDAREGRYYVLIEAKWHRKSGEQGKKDAKAWCKTAYELLLPYQTRERIHAPDSLNDDGLSPAGGYIPRTFKKLGEIKTKYDAQNFFRQNANILPQ
jgi:hypothetical protein